MRRAWPVALAMVLAGCGIEPGGVTDAGRAPTGLAPGVTLYFTDTHHHLVAQLRDSRRLGTIAEALTLLLEGPESTDSGTEITTDPGRQTLVVVTTTPGLIHLRVPLARYEVTALGIDQLVCTALGVWVQGGGARTTRVQVSFTLSTPESSKQRSCPLIT
jgi:hypothetical protein